MAPVLELIIQSFIHSANPIPVVLEIWQVSEFPGGLIKTVFWALLPDFLIQ